MEKKGKTRTIDRRRRLKVYSAENVSEEEEVKKKTDEVETERRSEMTALLSAPAPVAMVTIQRRTG